MPSTSKSILQRSAIVSGLVTRDELEEAIRRVREPVVGLPAPRVEIRDSLLAKELVAMGLVTSYQAAQLKAGRSKLTLGPYIITDWIAQGGMGQVFKAEHQMMGREVAIKVLPQGKSTPSAISNFTREIRTQAMLDHTIWSVRSMLATTGTFIILFANTYQARICDGMFARTVPFPWPRPRR